MNGEKVAIYNVNVNGEQRKAFDLIAVKQFLEEQKLKYSMLNVDPAEMGADEPAMLYVAKAAIDTLSEFELAIDKALGLYEEPEEIVEEKPEEEPEEPMEDKSKVIEPEVLMDESKPEEEPAESVVPEVPESETKDEITI